MNRYKIIILPTDEVTELVKLDNENRFFQVKTVTDRFFATSRYFEYQLLYIVDTQADVQVGDWVCPSQARMTEYPETSYVSKALFAEKASDRYFKVVASTDSSLGLPTPSRSFLETYCANPDLVIVNCTIFDDLKDCHIEYCTIEDKQKMIREIIEPKSTREQALSWWNNLASNIQLEYWRTYNTTTFTPSQSPEDLTGREIEEIYRKQTDVDEWWARLRNSSKQVIHQMIMEDPKTSISQFLEYD